MKQLLERWAELEPERCRLHKEVEGFTVKPGKWWCLILDCKLSAEESLIRIQWAVQEAATSRGWYINLFYHYEEWRAETGPKVPSDSFCKASNPAEALLAAYLKALEVSK